MVQQYLSDAQGTAPFEFSYIYFMWSLVILKLITLYTSHTWPGVDKRGRNLATTERAGDCQQVVPNLSGNVGTQEQVACQ